jgi:5-formyltetrahydrofolate cyclo-ligase
MIEAEKAALREEVWNTLDAANACESSSHGRIPNFSGAHEAAARLSREGFWKSARVVKVVPDAPQMQVRALSLSAGKLVYMAVPALSEPEPFVALDPGVISVSAEAAADRRTAMEIGQRTGLDVMQPVDLVITGSVAVNSTGARIGKGAGYGDIEVALLAEAGLIGPQTTICTTVHDLQVLDRPIPESEHDFHVDVIVTPTRVIPTSIPYRPAGIDWSSMPEGKIQAIPVLASRRAQ